MNLHDGQVFKAILTTKGRKTGNTHAVELRAVYYNKKFYFSRRNSNSDWLRNAITNPDVTVEYNSESHVGEASVVTDEDLAKKISQLKYSDKRSEEVRIVLEVRLYE